jgi:hypothetical protein
VPLTSYIGWMVRTEDRVISDNYPLIEIQSLVMVLSWAEQVGKTTLINVEG